MQRADKFLRQLGVDFTSYSLVKDESFASEVYFVKTQGPDRVLKFSHNPMKFWRETMSIEFLKDNFPVPHVISKVLPSSDFHGAILMDRIPGQSIRPDELTPELSRAAGKILAQLHSLKVPGFGQFDKSGFEKNPFKSWWQYRRDLVLGAWTKVIETRVDSQILTKSKMVLQKYYDIFSPNNEMSFVHCDFRFGNLLSQSGQLTGLIDFESARTGDPAYDFVKIYEVLIPNKVEHWNSFLRGYASVRPLPDLENLMPYYEFELSYGFLYWATSRSDESLFQKRLATVQKLLEKH